MSESKLIIIPARKGSKGLPGKNIKLLGNKSLISYSLEFAKNIVGNNDLICVSTNDEEVIKIANDLGIDTPFLRPEELAGDNISTYDVIEHAIDFYSEIDRKFSAIVLLQPTSPFRTISDFINMQTLFESNKPDMVVSAKVSKDNPYFNLFYEDKNGYLTKFVDNANFNYLQRQSVPPVYSYNGSIYFVKTASFLQKKNFNFEKIIKYVMPDNRSIDIDTAADWALAEFYLNNNK